VPAVHTEALAGRGETRRWMSAAADGASGDRVLASRLELRRLKLEFHDTDTDIRQVRRAIS